MTASKLIDRQVRILVSEPWEFNTECGVGPFTAIVKTVQPDVALLEFDAPLEYRKIKLVSVIARPRYAHDTLDLLLGTGKLICNFNFLSGHFVDIIQISSEPKIDMIAALGVIML